MLAKEIQSAGFNDFKEKKNQRNKKQSLFYACMHAHIDSLLETYSKQTSFAPYY